MDDLKKIKDNQLLENFSHLVLREREATVSVVAHLAEIDRRKLYAREGYSSLFAYIKDKFNYSGSSAYRRIQAARLSCRFPEILDLLIPGKLNLLSICLIEPHMTTKNGKNLIQQVIGKTKEQIEYLLANQFPRMEKTEDRIRRLPVIKREVPVDEVLEQTDKPNNPDIAASGATVGQECTQFKQTKLVEIRRVKLECVIDEAVAKKLERARDLLRAKYPKGRLEDILNEALDSLLDKKDPERKIERVQKKEEQKKLSHQNARKDLAPLNSHTRYIPAHLKQEVWKRDRGVCTFVSSNGRRCNEKGNLHLDHIRPFALGGETDKENLRLLCRAHNHYRAQQTFGIYPPFKTLLARTPY